MSNPKNGATNSVIGSITTPFSFNNNETRDTPVKSNSQSQSSKYFPDN